MVAVSVTVFVVGPLATTLLHRYFADRPRVPRALFLPDHGLRLPGFRGQPVHGRREPIAWTLPVEACCYAMAAAPRDPSCFDAATCSPHPAACSSCSSRRSHPFRTHPRRYHRGNLTLVVMLGATFVLGSLAYSLRGRLHLSWLVVVAHGALGGDLGGGWVRPSGVLAISFAVLVFAFRTPAWLRRLDGSRRRLLRRLCLRLPSAAVGGRDLRRPRSARDGNLIPSDFMASRSCPGTASNGPRWRSSASWLLDRRRMSARVWSAWQIGSGPESGSSTVFPPKAVQR